MIIINSLTLSPDYKTLTVDFNVDPSSTHETVGVTLYVGELYLSEVSIEMPIQLFTTYALPNYVMEIPIEAVSDYFGIPISNNGGYNKPIFDGIFTVVPHAMVGSEEEKTEGGIANIYYNSMALCHKVIQLDSVEKMNEVNLLYLLIEATNMYMNASQIEQGIGAYSRVNAICESYPQEFFDTDISPDGEGVGSWVINGVYTKR